MEYIEWQQSHFADHHLNGPIEVNLQTPSNIQSISKAGYDEVHNSYYHHNPSHVYGHNYALHMVNVPTNQTKEIGLKDITDIALTTLTFLSFGMFILHVLMCITASKEDTTNMAMVPIDAISNGEVTGGGTTEEIRRKRRSIHFQSANQIDIMDDMVKFALASIDTAVSTTKYKSLHHYYSLCEYNKHAKLQSDDRKVWIPIWSLAISWITGRLGAHDGAITFIAASKQISSFKALLIGISGGNCSAYYYLK